MISRPSETIRDGVGNPGDAGRLESRITTTADDREQEKAVPTDPLAQLTEDTAEGIRTESLDRAIINDPTITYEQIRDAIYKGISRWNTPGKERE